MPEGIVKMRGVAYCMISLFLVMSVGFMAGCSLGPDYEKPAVEVPKAFLYGGDPSDRAADIDWWELFQDPALNGLIQEALENNKNVQIAAANIEQADAVLMQVQSPLFPALGYSAEADNQRSAESSIRLPNNPKTAYQAFASASWELDLWGRMRRLSEAARADLLATREARQGVALSLTAAVATTYIQLLGLDDQLAVAKRSMAAYGESVALFDNQFRHGQVSQMVVEQARTQYETAAAEIPGIELAIIQTENALSILLGRNPGPVKRGKTIHGITLPPVPAGIPSDLLANRPDIRGAEQRLIAANAGIGAARALYFPSISLTGSFGYASEDLADLFDRPSRAWRYGGSVTGPIFTAGAIAGQVKEAEAIRQAALLSYASSIQNAFADVENALAARQKTSETLAAQDRLVRAGREYARLAALQYHSGYAPYSTVLQAQQQLFPAELKYVQSRASLFASLVDIYLAMGGGWATSSENLGTGNQPPESK